MLEIHSPFICSELVVLSQGFMVSVDSNFGSATSNNVTLASLDMICLSFLICKVRIITESTP